MIQIKEVNKTYSNNNYSINVLKDINLDIEKGTLVSIVGPSGTGKTTLLNCISGLSVIDTGSIQIDDVEITLLNEEEKQNFRRLKTGYIFQDFKLLPYHSVIDNVVLPLINDISIQELYSRAENLLEEVGISKRLFKCLPEHLSGGEKQRVSFARSLIGNPSIIFCDEPTGSLDHKNRDSILKVILGLKDKGITLIMVTHDPTVAKKSDHIYMLENGELKEQIGV